MFIKETFKEPEFQKQERYRVVSCHTGRRNSFVPVGPTSSLSRPLDQNNSEKLHPV